MKTLLLFLVLSHSSFSAPLLFKKITELDATEPYTAQVFHGGYLWVGRSRRNLSTLYEIELFDSSGRKVAQVSLPHALHAISPYGADSILAVGRQPGSKSSHSIVTWTGQTLKVKTTPHPLAGFAEDGTGIPGGPVYLVMIGGESPPPSTNPFADPEGYRTIFTVKSSSSISYMSTKLHNVGLIQQLGTYLFAIERHGMGAGDENLTRIDFRTQKADRVFPKANRKGLHRFIVLDDRRTLVASETEAGKIHFIDVSTNSVTRSVDIPAGTPVAIAQWGKCLVIGSEATRKLSFVSLKDPIPAIVGEWDLNEMDASFANIVNVAVDPASQSVFVRSTIACNTFLENCSVSRNSVWRITSQDANPCTGP